MNKQESPPQKQLEDVLQDPNADWSDIRGAMKAQGRSCTNAALMGAIASGKIVATASKKTLSEVDDTVSSSVGSLSVGGLDDVECRPEEDITNSRHRRPARRPVRRGSRGPKPSNL
eukprot:CAMPEP_0172320586 /NCGR_PEP_ID=MMETSP1058-20130122/40891_1 /TAXON_ID=83371 /ORGANISM="Detonula confervacea, Strain CCMP 353" /LENGTH=115 /DNA_ID=CAMNT_0013035877 /DNA_START=19 /DNA_END=362 /DNA_ORIENTATION=+